MLTRQNGWRLVGLLFLFSGGSKLGDPYGFLESIYSFQLPVPALVARLLALFLPVFEFLCGVLLVAGWWREIAAVSVFSLLCCFTLVTGQAWVRGLELSCGCFQLDFLSANLLHWLESAGVSFVRNLMLTLACAGLLWWRVDGEKAVRDGAIAVEP